MPLQETAIRSTSIETTKLDEIVTSDPERSSSKSTTSDSQVDHLSKNQYYVNHL